jgi:adenosylcobyric acid synthase
MTITKHRARAVAVLGTASEVGKTTVAAGLCRLLARQGIRVAPFKAQNMALNSFVTPEGGEIGRAQALQAQACGLEPHVDMNPILLKPESDRQSQVIIRGQALHSVEAQAYFDRRDELWTVVHESYDRLAESYEAIIIEGAGSAAEVNLREHDLVNWRMAHWADAKVLLVADIDRGGVFAQVLGTLDLLTPDERRRVVGLVINRFRGDPHLFADGVRYLESHTGLPVWLVPFLRDAHLDQEDSLDLTTASHQTFSDSCVNVAVVLVPRLSNFTDFNALAREEEVRLRYVAAPQELTHADVVILPGTKNTLADLQYLSTRGFGPALKTHVERGGELIGICGGYQMMGREIRDPDGLEAGGSSPGFGFLDIQTLLKSPKICRRIRGRVSALAGLRDRVIEGYEIHMGRIIGQTGPPCFTLHLAALDGTSGLFDPVLDEEEGTWTCGGRVWGTSIHGLFDHPSFRQGWINRARTRKGFPALRLPARQSPSASLDSALDRWADHLERHMNLTSFVEGFRGTFFRR